jgi:hypothetical protein
MPSESQSRHHCGRADIPQKSLLYLADTRPRTLNWGRTTDRTSGQPDHSYGNVLYVRILRASLASQLGTIRLQEQLFHVGQP